MVGFVAERSRELRARMAESAPCRSCAFDARQSTTAFVGYGHELTHSLQPKRMTPNRLARLAKLTWAAPCSLVGLLAAAIALPFGARGRVMSGVLEIALTRSETTRAAVLRRLPFRAITLGHVVIGAGDEDLDHSRAHELVHVRQYERWGLAFFIAYAASSAWQLMRGRRAYWDNHFEVEARRLSGE